MMEAGYDVSVANQNLDRQNSLTQQDTANPDQIYQSQHSQHQLQNQSSSDRAMEIPAAKV